MEIVIFFKTGELGNQIFQYSAIKKYNDSAKIISFGLDEINKIFDLDFINIKSPKKSDGTIYKFFYKLCITIFPVFLKILSQNLRLISSVGEQRADNGSEFIILKGLFKNITFFKQAYFQSENMIPPKAKNFLKFHSDLLEMANKKLNDYSGIHQNFYFVHLRRGDFVNWPNSKNPAVVPLRWFLEEIENIKKINPNALFLIFSNDRPYVEDFFNTGILSKDTILINDSQEIEFILMSLCRGGGILSPSTFAWWAAYLCKQSNESAYYVAPLYWIGHREGKWYPEGIKTSWLQYKPSIDS